MRAQTLGLHVFLVHCHRELTANKSFTVMVRLNIYYSRSCTPKWPFTITCNRAVTLYNCWIQVFHIEIQLCITKIQLCINNLLQQAFYPDIIIELLVHSLKENISAQKLLYFSFLAWVLDYHNICRRNRCHEFNSENKSDWYISRSIKLFQNISKLVHPVTN